MTPFVHIELQTTIQVDQQTQIGPPSIDGCDGDLHLCSSFVTTEDHDGVSFCNPQGPGSKCGTWFCPMILIQLAFLEISNWNPLVPFNVVVLLIPCWFRSAALEGQQNPTLEITGGETHTPIYVFLVQNTL